MFSVWFSGSELSLSTEMQMAQGKMPHRFWWLLVIANTVHSHILFFSVNLGTLMTAGVPRLTLLLVSSFSVVKFCRFLVVTPQVQVQHAEGISYFSYCIQLSSCLSHHYSKICASYCPHCIILKKDVGPCFLLLIGFRLTIKTENSSVCNGRREVKRVVILTVSAWQAS